MFVQGDSAAEETGTGLIKPHWYSAPQCPEAMHAVAGLSPHFEVMDRMSMKTPWGKEKVATNIKYVNKANG